jgi:drug/metabolite transporter (DMT)-like permease
MSLIIACCAALLCAFNNLFMRKSIDFGGSSKGFLVTSLSFSILVAVFLGPVRTGFFHWNNTIAIMGLVTGLFLGIMMWALGKALEKGPPGLTIAYLNASNLIPAILMMLVFGVAFGYRYAWGNAVGSLLVAAGLFWAVWQTSKDTKSQSFWLTFSTIAFITDVCFLVLIQWRALVITPGLPGSKWLPFTINFEEAEWFMPMLFAAATSFIVYQFMKEGNRPLVRSEVQFGLLGGVCNAASTYLLIKAAQFATPFTSAMIFPIFAVGIVLLCNIWGRLLYKEKVHWKAMNLCLVGLFVGTIDWSNLLN